MDTLSKLFGTELRVKMIRFFLFNPDASFDLDQIEKKMLSRKKVVAKEILSLKKLGLVREVKKTLENKKKVKAFLLDPKFEFAESLSEFFVRIHSLDHKSIVKKIEKTGKVKLVLISGIFTRDLESRLDLFVVGDNVNSASMDRIVKGIEAGMGKDIRYAVLSAPDFAYRMGMNDKLIRDIFDYPYQLLVDKLGVGKA
jgi:hypothetical protein